MMSPRTIPSSSLRLSLQSPTRSNSLSRTSLLCQCRLTLRTSLPRIHLQAIMLLLPRQRKTRRRSIKVSLQTLMRMKMRTQTLMMTCQPLLTMERLLSLRPLSILLLKQTHLQPKATSLDRMKMKMRMKWISRNLLLSRTKHLQPGLSRRRD